MCDAARANTMLSADGASLGKPEPRRQLTEERKIRIADLDVGTNSASDIEV
ncbi:hypothetical protein BH09GEM1_BH09GEM1_09530 [soil metagenome]